MAVVWLHGAGISLSPPLLGGCGVLRTFIEDKQCLLPAVEVVVVVAGVWVIRVAVTYPYPPLFGKC